MPGSRCTGQSAVVLLQSSPPLAAIPSVLAILLLELLAMVLVVGDLSLLGSAGVCLLLGRLCCAVRSKSGLPAQWKALQSPTPTNPHQQLAFQVLMCLGQSTRASWMSAMREEAAQQQTQSRGATSPAQLLLGWTSIG